MNEWKSIENDLEKASTTITWNIEHSDSTNFIHQLRQKLNDFEQRLFKSKTNLDEIKKYFQYFLKTPLYSRNENRQDPLLIISDKENRNNKLKEIGFKLKEILKVKEKSNFFLFFRRNFLDLAK